MIARLLPNAFGESHATRRKAVSGDIPPRGRIRAEFRPFFRTDDANARISA